MCSKIDNMIVKMASSRSPDGSRTASWTARGVSCSLTMPHGFCLKFVLVANPDCCGAEDVFRLKPEVLRDDLSMCQAIRLSHS